MSEPEGSVVVIVGHEHKPPGAETANHAYYRRQDDREAIAKSHEKVLREPAMLAGRDDAALVALPPGGAAAARRLGKFFETSDNFQSCWESADLAAVQLEPQGLETTGLVEAAREYEAAIRGVISEPALIRHPLTRRLLDGKRSLHDAALIRALRNAKHIKRIVAELDWRGATRTPVDLWLLLHLKDHKEWLHGRSQVRIKYLVKHLTEQLEKEDLSKAPWCLDDLEAADFRGKIERRLKHPQDVQRWLIKVGWHTPQSRQCQITSKPVTPPPR